MISLLFFGFLIGMRHALEADHLAAVAAISTKEHSLKSSIKHGLIWGIGHTLTLFMFGAAVFWMNTSISVQTADILELIVGIMLFLLGVDVIRHIIKQRIHYHFHRHGDALIHFHAHSHVGQSEHKDNKHKHSHEKFPYRTLFIGLMHGLAGTAALILLTLNNSNSITFSLMYIVLFGLGSIIGMVLLSVIIAVPLRASSKLTWLHNSLQVVIGATTMGLGLYIVKNSTVWL